MPESDRPAGHLAALGIPLSEDGYFRMLSEKVRIFAWIHLVSGIDRQLDEERRELGGGTNSPIAGYTEWVTATTPALSLGWDWTLEAPDGALCYRRIAEPRSNIMLVDIHHQDLGDSRSAAALGIFVDEMSWEQTVCDYIRDRYA